MIGQRLRLNQHERAYLLRLIAEDNKNVGLEMIGKPVLKLMEKLKLQEEEGNN